MKHWYLSPLAITAKNKIQKNKMDILDAIKGEIPQHYKKVGCTGDYVQFSQSLKSNTLTL
jgi:hypothetical protein